MAPKIDSKGIISIILAKKNPKKEIIEKEDESPEMGDEEIAAEEILSAIKNKDVKAFSEALKSFISLCNYED